MNSNKFRFGFINLVVLATTTYKLISVHFINLAVFFLEFETCPLSANITDEKPCFSLALLAVQAPVNGRGALTKNYCASAL